MIIKMEETKKIDLSDDKIREKILEIENRNVKKDSDELKTNNIDSISDIDPKNNNLGEKVVDKEINKQESTEEVETFDSLGLFKNKKNVFYMFITPPIIISIISAIHLIDFYQIGNPDWISYALAGSIELASIASLLALVFLGKIKKGALIFLFSILIIIQLLGNMYFSFVYFQNSNTLKSILDFFAMDNNLTSLRILSFIISGVPVIISLSFIKISMSYME